MSNIDLFLVSTMATFQGSRRMETITYPTALGDRYTLFPSSIVLLLTVVHETIWAPSGKISSDAERRFLKPRGSDGGIAQLVTWQSLVGQAAADDL
jgi:hypothetical protein